VRTAAWLVLLAACKQKPPATGPELPSAPPPEGTPANVLVLLLDDTGQDKVSAYGVHPDPPQTPHIDALAAQGMRFTQAWAYPMCSSTRAALLTGQHTRRYGIGDRLTPNVSSWELVAGETLTLPQALGASPWPWDSSMLGKWHLSAGNLGQDPLHHPLDHGFAWSEGSLANLYAALTDTYPQAERDYFLWEEIRNGEVSWKETYATTEVVDDALRRAPQMQEPWLMWVALPSAHDPLHVPPPSLYSGPEPVTELELMDAMVEAMDAEIGRLLDGLPPALLARTNVVLMGDNGTPSHGIAPPLDPGRGKSSVYEGGVRVPFVVAGPAVAQPGTVSDALVSVVDLYPTLIELAGADPAQLPTVLDGQSFLPVLSDPMLSDPTQPRRDTLYADFFYPNGPGPYSFSATSVRDARYKYVRTEEGGEVVEELFRVEPQSLDEGEDLLGGGTLGTEEQEAWERLSGVLLETRQAL
jgi:arylsulfatase B